MNKTKKTFHVHKNFQALGFRMPWWVIGNFFGRGGSERLKNETGRNVKWKKENNK